MILAKCSGIIRAMRRRDFTDNSLVSYYKLILKDLLFFPILFHQI